MKRYFHGDLTILVYESAQYALMKVWAPNAYIDRIAHESRDKTNEDLVWAINHEARNDSGLYTGSVHADPGFYHRSTLETILAYYAWVKDVAALDEVADMDYPGNNPMY